MKLLNKKYCNNILFYGLFITFLLRILLFIVVQPWDVTVQNNIVLYDDPIEYHNLAVNLLEHSKYSESLDSPSNALRTPLYPFFMMIIYFLFGVKPFIVIIFQIFIDCISAWILYHSILKISTRYIASISLLLYGVNPFIIFQCNTLFSDSLLLFFITSFFYLFVSYLYSDFDKWRNYYLYLSALVLGLATLTKPIVLYLTIPISVFIIFINKKQLLISTKRTVFFLLIYTITILPWYLRNYATFGEFALSTSQSINSVLLVASPIKSVAENISLDSCSYLIFNETDVLILRDKLNPEKMNDFQKSKYWQEVSLEYIGKYPKVALVQYCNGIFHNFFNLNTNYFAKYLHLKNYDARELNAKEISTILSLFEQWFLKKSKEEKIIGSFLFLFLLLSYSITIYGFVKFI